MLQFERWRCSSAGIWDSGCVREGTAVGAGQDRRGVMAQQPPKWKEVAVFSMKTMGLWSTFEALCLHESVLQRAEAFSLADQEVETIVDALVEGICSRLGVGSAPHASRVGVWSAT